MDHATLAKSARPDAAAVRFTLIPLLVVLAALGALLLLASAVARSGRVLG